MANPVKSVKDDPDPDSKRGTKSKSVSPIAAAIPSAKGSTPIVTRVALLSKRSLGVPKSLNSSISRLPILAAAARDIKRTKSPKIMRFILRRYFTGKSGIPREGNNIWALPPSSSLQTAIVLLYSMFKR